MGLCLFVVLLTYRSFETQYIFYFSWLSGLTLTGLFICLTLYRCKLSRAATVSLSFVVPWVILGIVFSNFAYDRPEHIKTLLITTFYMTSSVFIADMLVRSRINMEKYAYQMLILWVLVNLALLVLFFLGVYKPPKGDFSGVFHDRNVFSITTLLVMTFAVTHLRKKPKQLYTLGMYVGLIICIGMILISKSITGLLGLLVLSVFYSFKLPINQRIIIFSTLVIALAGLLFTDNPISARIDRFLIAISGDTDSLRTSESAYLRIFLIQSGFELFSEHKWVGVGLNNAKEFVIWPNRGVGSFLHNNYLDILTSGGLPLFVVYYTPIFYALTWLLMNKKKVRLLADKKSYDLWKLALVGLSLKLVYDLTWTTYFEFFMVFTVMLSIYIVFHLKTSIRRHKSTLNYKVQQS
ncbi:hypothetical protein JCM19236_5052 [Vibrio sp. JCM 19236]|nr:hypothetical protein JCM19236_5052 [Vibrio sp. JCM 19236]